MVFTMGEDHTEIYPRANECYANGCPTDPPLPDNPMEIEPPQDEIDRVKVQGMKGDARGLNAQTRYSSKPCRPRASPPFPGSKMQRSFAARPASSQARRTTDRWLGASRRPRTLLGRRSRVDQTPDPQLLDPRLS